LIEPPQTGFAFEARVEGLQAALKDFKLKTKRDHLNLQISSPSEAGNEAGEKGT
jgi:hypothetical protein